MSEINQNNSIKLYLESGVIPFRKNGGRLEILLITNKKKTKWGIPKGIIEKEYTPWDSAAMEAYEEAGIRGKVFRPSVGKYSIEKWDGQCDIKVYLMEVLEVLEKYPEDMLRKRQWFSLDDAIDNIKNKKLGKLIKKFPEKLGEKYEF